MSEGWLGFRQITGRELENGSFVLFFRDWGSETLFGKQVFQSKQTIKEVWQYLIPFCSIGQESPWGT